MYYDNEKNLFSAKKKNQCFGLAHTCVYAHFCLLCYESVICIYYNNETLHFVNSNYYHTVESHLVPFSLNSCCTCVVLVGLGDVRMSHMDKTAPTSENHTPFPERVIVGD